MLNASQTRTFDTDLIRMQLRVDGTNLLNSKSETVWLRGVNIASLEWTDRGEHMEEAFHEALQGWKANLIRMPLAQDRWFGKSPHQTDGGADYRSIVDKLVEVCAGAGAYIDLDLHWSDRGEWSNEGGKLAQHQMPDENSIMFWRDVAVRYRNHPNVLFGLYNEPHDVPWSVWRDGGIVTEQPSKRETNQRPVSYRAVGLQKLYETVRAASAENIVTVSGLDWGYDLSGVLEGYGIHGSNIVYETHPYPYKKDWDRNFGAVSRTHVVLLGEWGGAAKDMDYGRHLMDYARSNHLHWTAWCFHPTCGPSLLKNWRFEPNDFGAFVKETLGSH